MTSGMIFVLHGAGEEKFAGDLTSALAPLPALPVRLTAGEGRGVQFGAGAVCIVVWTQELEAPAKTDALLAAVTGAIATIVLCGKAGAALPEALRTRASACLTRHGDAAADAGQLRDVIAGLEHAVDAAPQDRARRSAPLIGGESDSAAHGGRQSMAVRSAYGLVATLAVVGVAAPLIAQRAGAANVAPRDASPAQTAATQAAADAEDGVVAAANAAQPAATPSALDQWLSAASASNVATVDGLIVETAAHVPEAPAAALTGGDKPDTPINAVFGPHARLQEAAELRAVDKQRGAEAAIDDKPVQLVEGDGAASAGD